MTEAMNEAVRALSAKETIELIGTDLAAFADGGPNRRKEDIELGRTAGLDIEMISARWDEAERVVQVSLNRLRLWSYRHHLQRTLKKFTTQYNLRLVNRRNHNLT